MTYFPLTNTYPASQYWGIDLRSCTYGSRTIISTRIAGILDTGDPSVFALYACRDTYLFSSWTGILIPDDLFRIFLNAIPGAKFDTKIGLIEIPPSRSSSHDEQMQPLHFKFGDHTFTLDVQSQLLPRSMNTECGGDVEKQYGIIGPIGHVAGDANDVDFVLGIPFMQKYYTVSSGSCFEKSMLNGHPWQVYDANKRRIGFAPSQAYVLV